MRIGNLTDLGQSAPLWQALVGFSLLVASIYVVNQITDIESDRINRKLFLLPHGYVSVRTAWILAVVCAVSGLFLASLIGLWMTILFGTGLVLGVLYNLPPANLKNRAIGGVLANSLGHGMVTFLVGWLAAKSNQNLSFSLFGTGLTSSLAPALANGAVFLATTIPDAQGDLQTGKKTFCVVYGPKTTALVASLFCSLALISSFFMENHFWVMALPSLISLGFFVNSALTAQIESAYYAFKWPVFLLSVFVALYVPVYGVLILITFISSRLYYRWRFGIEYPSFKSK
ncbi:MAG: UbiA family prenyltransferase [Chitinispirillaceae bacterium]